MSAQVVGIARAWIGTPYLHQASVQGVGCDCLGLLRGIWREVYGQEPEAIPAYTQDWSEPQGAERLLTAAHRHLKDVSNAPFAAGQVILFRMRQRAVAKHLGLLSHDEDALKFIHAYQGHGVVESPLSAPWRKRIAARFAFIERDD
ncbi:NlpC/P60 family putative phage cell wall peptidase [Yoonia maricola]|uniref:NlpC/P60 family putative phage cell wall peptidase n=1 Tax=Yoonia maricola TaxID=420999 RepID=A0A2M8WMJ6_9RHOB|nr:NlpC/P60 family protein [Yoonia maricola]PJI92145.1 NlpC/P60 family putative phage cell wall peptidase [Yoonia maricola]